MSVKLLSGLISISHKFKKNLGYGSFSVFMGKKAHTKKKARKKPLVCNS